MPQRNRLLRMRFYVTPEEQQVIFDNIQKAKSSNASEYLRKMALNGYVIHYDPDALYEILRLQSITANNLNQLTKRAHETGNVYQQDIAALDQQFQTINQSLQQLIMKIGNL